MVTRFLALCTLMAALPAYAENAISPEELVREYTSTLARQQRNAFKFTASAVRDGQDIMHQADGRTAFSASGELICDGRRIALRMRRWGQYAGHQAIPASNPRYWRQIYDGRELWSYHRSPTDELAPYGKLFITPNPTHMQIWDIVRISYPGHYLLGYISEVGIRMDEILRDRSTKLALRPEPDKVGGVECYVLDVSSKFGRGTLWLDPEHGCNIAQAYFNVRSGDIADGTVAAGRDSHLFLRDVRFELVDGVWFPTRAATEWRLAAPECRETIVRQHRLTGVKLNPDMDAMNAFSTADIPDGAECKRRPSQAKFIWQSGRLVPAPG